MHSLTDDFNKLEEERASISPSGQEHLRNITRRLLDLRKCFPNILYGQLLQPQVKGQHFLDDVIIEQWFYYLDVVPLWLKHQLQDGLMIHYLNYGGNTIRQKEHFEKLVDFYDGNKLIDHFF